MGTKVADAYVKNQAHKSADAQAVPAVVVQVPDDSQEERADVPPAAGSQQLKLKRARGKSKAASTVSGEPKPKKQKKQQTLKQTIADADIIAEYDALMS